MTILQQSKGFIVIETNYCTTGDNKNFENQYIANAIPKYNSAKVHKKYSWLSIKI